MSASQYNFGASSQTDDLLLGIIQRLGLQIESSTGINPDAQFEYRFVASDYNYGNRSQTDDLLEEILNRIDQLGGGGGGGADGNDRTKVSANDTTAGFLQDKFNVNQSEVLFSVTNDGANENMKLLAQFATRIGERAMVGTTTGTAKFTVKGDAGVPIVQHCLADGLETFRIDENGDKIFTSYGFSTGNLKFIGDTVIASGTDISNVARMRITPNRISFSSFTGQIRFTDAIYMTPSAGFRNLDGANMLSFHDETWGIVNGVNCHTGMSFGKSSVAEPHLSFRTNAIINLDAQGSGSAGDLLINVQNQTRWSFTRQGNFIYHSPQFTGYADAAAVQADAAIPVGSIAVTVNGTLVRKL